MKANNAPKKLYYAPYGDIREDYPITDNDIEYIRKDAFIEKAADYIKKDMLDNLAFQGRLNRIEIIDGIIEKFIKAMKGEQGMEMTLETIADTKEEYSMDDKKICASCKHLKKGVCPDWFEDCKLRKVYEEQLKRNRV